MKNFIKKIRQSLIFFVDFFHEVAQNKPLMLTFLFLEKSERKSYNQNLFWLLIIFKIF